jgi:hypothetical protein
MPYRNNSLIGGQEQVTTYLLATSATDPAGTVIGVTCRPHRPLAGCTCSRSASAGIATTPVSAMTATSAAATSTASH